MSKQEKISEDNIDEIKIEESDFSFTNTLNILFKNISSAIENSFNSIGQITSIKIPDSTADIVSASTTADIIPTSSIAGTSGTSGTITLYRPSTGESVILPVTINNKGYTWAITPTAPSTSNYYQFPFFTDKALESVETTPKQISKKEKCRCSSCERFIHRMRPDLL